MPLLIAERDREFLKQYRINREEERELMKDVPGWVVGTWYGEPIYHTVPKDKLVEPHWLDLCVHAPYKTWADRATFHLWN
jgi:NADH dehydrogenase (ubiquinone) 1 alpha subcomplex subunit 13